MISIFFFCEYGTFLLLLWHTSFNVRSNISWYCYIFVTNLLLPDFPSGLLWELSKCQISINTIIFSNSFSMIAYYTGKISRLKNQSSLYFYWMSIIGFETNYILRVWNTITTKMLNCSKSIFSCGVL